MHNLYIVVYISLKIVLNNVSFSFMELLGEVNTNCHTDFSNNLICVYTICSRYKALKNDRKEKITSNFISHR